MEIAGDRRIENELIRDDKRYLDPIFDEVSDLKAMHNFTTRRTPTHLSIAASGFQTSGSQKSREISLRLGKLRSRTFAPLNFLYTSGFYGRPPAITTTDPRPDSGQHRQNGYRYYRPQAQDVSENRARKRWRGDAPGHGAQNTHLGTTDTDPTYSNGHRKAPKSNNDYKLLLHKVEKRGYPLESIWNGY
jgi:hypothetical protein